MEKKARPSTRLCCLAEGLKTKSPVVSPHLWVSFVFSGVQLDHSGFHVTTAEGPVKTAFPGF